MDTRSTRSITFLLAGIVLLVTVAGVFVTCAPVINCPEPPHGKNGPDAGCTRCWGEDRITLWNKWFWKSHPDDIERKKEFEPGAGRPH